MGFFNSYKPIIKNTYPYLFCSVALIFLACKTPQTQTALSDLKPIPQKNTLSAPTTTQSCQQQPQAQMTSITHEEDTVEDGEKKIHCEESNLSDLKSLHQNDVYKSACTKTSQKKFEAEIRSSLTQDRKPDEAWQIVRTILCDQGKEAEQFLANHIQDSILVRQYQTGEEDSVYHSQYESAELLLQCHAWDASVISGGESISVSYRPNEACLASFDLMFLKGRWLVIEISSYCD